MRFQGAFPARQDEAYSQSGKRPVIFDVMAPDKVTSILPQGIKMVMWVNPSNMSLKYARKVERIQTLGGWVEQHWGDDAQTIDISASTGGFMRLYTGVSSVTSPNMTGGTRRETSAYDSYLDMLALFHNNGSVYDVNGKVAFQGSIKLTFDGGVYLGWFTSFSVQESADKPFQFTLSATLDIMEEVQVWRSVVSQSIGGESRTEAQLIGEAPLR